MKIDKKEVAKRAHREGISEKYFKKKSDKFDKLDYLADLYKLIEQNLMDIQAEIEENDRLEREEEEDNMRKMVKDKYSMLTALSKSNGKSDMTFITEKLHHLLDNMRFADGRSLRDVIEE